MKKLPKLSIKSTKSKKNEIDNHEDFSDDEFLKDNNENSEKLRQDNILPDLETDMPSRAWRRMSETQTFKTVAPLNIHSPVKPDCLRFVCLSDTHSKLHADEMSNFYVPPGDILLHAGDFSMKGRPLEIERFNEALDKLPHKKKIVIAGNHELSFDESLFTEANCFGESIGTVKRCLKTKGLKSVRELLTNAIYLQDSMVTVCGINIYGSPWQPRFGCWAFNVIRGEDILKKWNCIPENVDILITHGPPVGHGDVTKAGINVGCVELLNTVQKRVKPKYHLFGHIHEGYGLTTDGETLFINASSCTKGYKLCNPPMIFDVPLPSGQSKDSLLESVEVVSYSKEESSSKPVIDISQKDKDNKLLTLTQLKLTTTKTE
ncbi:metallophosphoesterase MPPED2-like [Mytilus trossulus]|uniref:metallophosphoesterase MPPED2-like n=1 Tax=Mytilus trossulus TaxID=6551 RepID=UPI0030044561